MASRFWVGGTSSWNGTALLKWATTSGGVGGAAEPTAADNVFFDGIATGGGAAGAITVTVATSTRVCLDLNLAGFAGTFTGTVGLTLSGGLTMPTAAAATWSYTGAMSFQAATGPRTIQSNGYVFGGTMTWSGSVGVVFQNLDAFTCTAAVQLTRGVWDCNSQTIKVASFIAGTGAGFARTWALANSLFEVTGTGGISEATATGLTVTTGGSSKIKFSGVTAATPFNLGALFTVDDVEFSGGNNTLTITPQLIARDLLCTNPGTGTIAFGNSVTFRNIDFTGFGGTWAVGGALCTLKGSLTCVVGMTFNYTGLISLSGTAGTQTITSAGKTFATLSCAGLGSSKKLADNVLLSVAFVSGAGCTTDASGITIQAPKFTLTSGLDLTNTVCTCTGDVNAYIISSAPTLTGSELKTVNSSAVNKTFSVTGAIAFNKVTWTGTGTGQFVTTGTFSIDTLTVSAGATMSPSSITLRKLNAVGTLALPITWNGPVAIPPAFLCPANDVVCDYLILSNCSVGGGARWFAGRHSVDVGNNYGWRFTDQYRSPVALAG